MKKKLRPRTKKRPTLAEQYARLKAANDRMEAGLKTAETPDEWLGRTWGNAFKPIVRHSP